MKNTGSYQKKQSASTQYHNIETTTTKRWQSQSPTHSQRPTRLMTSTAKTPCSKGTVPLPPSIGEAVMPTLGSRNPSHIPSGGAESGVKVYVLLAAGWSAPNPPKKQGKDKQRAGQDRRRRAGLRIDTYRYHSNQRTNSTHNNNNNNDSMDFFWCVRTGDQIPCS
jgi:hypothetical protein